MGRGGCWFKIIFPIYLKKLKAAISFPRFVAGF